MVFVAIESHKMTDLRVRSPEDRDFLKHQMPSLLEQNEIYYPVFNEYHDALEKHDKINFSATTVYESLKNYNESFGVFEKMFTDSIYNEVVHLLWTYCTVVITKLDRMAQDAELSEFDLHTIGFAEGHDYTNNTH